MENPQSYSCQSLTLNPKGLVYALSVESHDDRAINDDHRSCHVAKSLEIGESPRILRDVPLLKLYTLLRKILFRLVAEHSPMLGINHNILRHSPPPVGVVPVAGNRWMDSFAPPMASRTGLPE
jgi:hypothetical protein